jgi:hypothetical protein
MDSAVGRRQPSSCSELSQILNCLSSVSYLSVIIRNIADSTIDNHCSSTRQALKTQQQEGYNNVGVVRKE